MRTQFIVVSKTLHCLLLFDCFTLRCIIVFILVFHCFYDMLVALALVTSFSNKKIKKNKIKFHQNALYV